MEAYLNCYRVRPDGDRGIFWTQAVEARESSLWWHDRGLSFTATGYGSRIPTRYMVKFNGRWRRVYCRQYSNVGTLYIGKLSPLGQNILVLLEA